MTRRACSGNVPTPLSTKSMPATPFRVVLCGMGLSAAVLLSMTGCAAPGNNGESMASGTQSAMHPAPRSSTAVASSGGHASFARVTVTHTYPGVGAVISPPYPDQDPRVNEHAARAIFKTTSKVGEIVGAPLKPDSVRLATYENAFGETHPHLPDTPSVPAQLAWVGEYHYPDRGPMSGPVNEPKSPPPHGSTCTLTVAISANTGAPLDSFQFCSMPTPASTAAGR